MHWPLPQFPFRYSMRLTLLTCLSLGSQPTLPDKLLSLSLQVPHPQPHLAPLPPSPPCTVLVQFILATPYVLVQRPAITSARCHSQPHFDTAVVQIGRRADYISCRQQPAPIPSPLKKSTQAIRSSIRQSGSATRQSETSRSRASVQSLAH